MNKRNTFVQNKVNLFSLVDDNLIEIASMQYHVHLADQLRWHITSMVSTHYVSTNSMSLCVLSLCWTIHVNTS